MKDLHKYHTGDFEIDDSDTGSDIKASVFAGGEISADDFHTRLTLDVLCLLIILASIDWKSTY